MFKVGDKVRLIGRMTIVYPDWSNVELTIESIHPFPNSAIPSIVCSHPTINNVTLTIMETSLELYNLNLVPLSQSFSGGISATPTRQSQMSILKQLYPTPIFKSVTSEFMEYIIPYYGDPVPIKCECGAESLGYTTHSTWCQKHEK